MWRLGGGRTQNGRAGIGLYRHAVEAARAPVFYEAFDPVAGSGFGVPDTLDGRFDMICLMVALLVRRLRQPAPVLAQSLFDAMFRDMDASLRELGVGDLGVPRRVATMWQAFNGRCQAYDAALRDARCPGGTTEALSACLARNIWRALPREGANAVRLAPLVLAIDRSLSLQPDAALADGMAFIDGIPGVRRPHDDRAPLAGPRDHDEDRPHAEPC